ETRQTAVLNRERHLQMVPWNALMQFQCFTGVGGPLRQIPIVEVNDSRSFSVAGTGSVFRRGLIGGGKGIIEPEGKRDVRHGGKQLTQMLAYDIAHMFEFGLHRGPVPEFEFG